MRFQQGRYIPQTNNMSHFTKPTIEPDEKPTNKDEVKGIGLEKMGDNLDRLIVKPLKKPKNIKF